MLDRYSPPTINDSEKILTINYYFEGLYICAHPCRITFCRSENYHQCNNSVHACTHTCNYIASGNKKKN